MPSLHALVRVPAILALVLCLGLPGTLRAELPAGWSEYTVGPLTLALPGDWQVMEESPDFAGFFSGDMTARSGYGFALGLDSDPAGYLEEVIAVAAGTARFDGVDFDRYTFTADDGEGMAGEGEIYISATPLVENDHAVLLLTALNTPYADGAADYTAILATLDLAVAQSAPPPAGTAQGDADLPGDASPSPVGDAVGGALGGLFSLTLPPDWHSYDSPGGDEIGLLPVSAEGSVVLARGAAAKALIAEAAVAGAPVDATVIGQPSQMQLWQGSLAEFSDGAGFVPGLYRLHVLGTCLPGNEHVAVLIGGTDRFHAGDALKALFGGVTINLPADAAPCVRQAETAAAAPVGTAPAPAPAPAQLPASDAAALPPPVPGVTPGPGLPAVPEAASLYPEDIFAPESADWTLYQNGRYGTFISYPSSYFLPEPAPDAADGRAFASVDGQASFLVYASWNALGLDQGGLMVQDRTLMDPQREITFEDSGPGWYVMSGLHSRSQIFYRRVLVEGPEGLIQTFEILYPAIRKAEFEPIVAYMAGTFGPGTSWEDGWDGWVASDGAASGEYDPAGQGMQVDPGALYTPEKGTAARKGILDAARGAVEPAIGLPVIFVVSVLRTDDTWAYLQAEPRNPDGSPLNWARTAFARDWQNGVMSDVVMVLLQFDGSNWFVVDHIIGPTDVFWYNWIEMFGLPEALFTP